MCVTFIWFSNPFPSKLKNLHSYSDDKNIVYGIYIIMQNMLSLIKIPIFKLCVPKYAEKCAENAFSTCRFYIEICRKMRYYHQYGLWVNNKNTILCCADIQNCFFFLPLSSFMCQIFTNEQTKLTYYFSVKNI